MHNMQEASSGGSPLFTKSGNLKQISQETRHVTTDLQDKQSFDFDFASHAAVNGWRFGAAEFGVWCEHVLQAHRVQMPCI